MALLGSGEFDPWSEPVERWLLWRSRNPDGPVLIAPTAAAHEGDTTFDFWANKGLDHYRALGIAAEVLPMKTAQDAHRDDLVSRLESASAVFFSGGNPARLAGVLRDSPFWEALTAAHAAGLPYAGCSAGVAYLTEMTYDSDSQDFEHMWAPGLGYVRDVLFGPHWDIVDTWVPGASRFIVESVRPGQAFVGLEEETALVGDGSSWTVMGRQAIHVLRDGEWASYRDGDAVDLPFELGS